MLGKFGGLRCVKQESLSILVYRVGISIRSDGGADTMIPHLM